MFFAAEGDLDSFVRTKKHYRTRYKAEQLSRNLFLIDNRPEFIRNVYNGAAEKPLEVIKCVEEYREDELVVSKFSSNLHNRDNKSHSEPDLEIETRKVSTFYLSTCVLFTGVQYIPLSLFTTIRGRVAPELVMNCADAYLCVWPLY